jgi:hypothetical protein
MLFNSVAGTLPRIPSDLTIPQFILDSQHELRPERPQTAPWLIADKSGKKLGLEQVRRVAQIRGEPTVLRNGLRSLDSQENECASRWPS